MQLRFAALAAVCVAANAFAFDWNVPEALAWAEVGEQIQANGMPMKLSSGVSMSGV